MTIANKTIALQEALTHIVDMVYSNTTDTHTKQFMNVCLILLLANRLDEVLTIKWKGVEEDSKQMQFDFNNNNSNGKEVIS